MSRPSLDESPTSEVGLDHNDPRVQNEEVSDEKWMRLMEQQNRNFMSLIQSMKTSSTSSHGFRLPDFDPEKKDVDARAWVTTADICLTDRDQHGAPLMVALSRALKGGASTWLSTVSFPGMTWTDFKRLFIARYDISTTVASFLIDLHASKPRENECYASYAAALMTSIMARWNGLSTERLAIATTMAHISQFDRRIHRLSFTTDIQTRAQLQQELQAVSFMKRKLQGDDHDAPDKRYKPNSTAKPLKCFSCGKPGHKSIQCYRKDLQRGMQATPKYHKQGYGNGKSSPTPAKFHATGITCFNCRAQGHYASSCPRRNERSSAESGIPNSSSEKRVDLCILNAPTGTLRHSGEQFSFCYDSGAECSLMRESVTCKFKGKRIDETVTMTGIGQTSVNSIIQILALVEIDDIDTEICFHVLPDHFLRYDIMIGREILEHGLTVQMTSDRIKFLRCPLVASCEVERIPKINWNTINTDVPADNREKLVSILQFFEKSFTSGIPTAPADTEPMKIRLKDPSKTVNRRPYRLSVDERKVVRGKIDELLRAGIIRPSSSPHASPMLLVEKKDKSFRLCVDYRELNDNTISDRFPLPLISDQIDRLHGGHYFSTIDLASGFHQIPIETESIECTAFVTPEGHFEYLTMPFGLKNAPAVFQRAMINALGDLVNTYVVVYMDDILILANNVDEALERLRIVLKVLAEKNFTINLKKCAFLKQKVEYLGFEVAHGEIRPNPRKIEALTALPPPETVTQLRQFIGLASYFRQFVPRFSQVMTPLYALTSGNGKLTWKPEHEEVRQKVVAALTHEPVLMIHDPEAETEVHTDASAIGYGAVLQQKKEGKLHPVAYYSKRTSDAESRYHSYELETLAVVNAVKHFRHYLHGRKFRVVTDCSSLQSARKKLDLTPRVHRWWAFLQGFDFDIVHREGKQMCHADFFSRNPLPQPETKINVSEKVVQKQVYIAELSRDWLMMEQQRDPEILKLLTDMDSNELPADVAKTYEQRSGVLHRKVQRNGKNRCLPIVPRPFRWSVVNNVHEGLLHLGWEKTLEKLYDLYWFEKMSKFVRKFVENCVTCRISKTHAGKIQAEMHPIPKVAIPWHTLHIDATGKLSGKNDQKEYVFVLIDAFTKYVLLQHTLRIDTVSSIKALKACVAIFGAPSRLIADQGRCFASKEFREYCASAHIKLHLIATGTSRANGQVERVMSTLKDMLTAVETSNRSWQDALPDVQLALNCTVNRVTKASPLELLIGKTARPIDIMTVSDEEPLVDIVEARKMAVENMEKASAYDKKRFDSTKARIQPFSVGDFVLLQREERNQTKLDPKYGGPFKVSEVLDGDRYVLKSLSSARTYKYAHDRLRKITDVNAHIDDDQENDTTRDSDKTD